MAYSKNLKQINKVLRIYDINGSPTNVIQNK